MWSICRFAIEPSTSNASPDATLKFVTTEALADFAVEGRVFIAKNEPSQPARLLRVITIVQPDAENLPGAPQGRLQLRGFQRNPRG